jgi:hypothetical protein
MPNKNIALDIINYNEYTRNITPFLISNAHFIGQKIRKNVKSIVGISPTMVLLFPVLLL